MENEKVYRMSFAKIHPLLLNKAVKKGRTADEVNKVICWLTGYSVGEIEEAVSKEVSYEEFFRNAPELVFGEDSAKRVSYCSLSGNILRCVG